MSLAAAPSFAGHAEAVVFTNNGSLVLPHSSCSDADALAWPVKSLVRFWKNHHLLDLLERPVWRVLKGRSRAYVEAVVASLEDVRVSSPVESVKRLAGAGVDHVTTLLEYPGD